MSDPQTDIARRFGRAAAQYDAAATVQRLASAQLSTMLPESAAGKTVLDIGSGSGIGSAHWQQQGARVLALDIAIGMLRHSRSLSRGHAWLAGDAQALPLAAGSVDICFSNLALQWCVDWTAAWREIHRVLRPGGTALVSTLATGSMQPLRSAWAQVDDVPHSHRFGPESVLQAAVTALPWSRQMSIAQTETLYFATLPALLHSLRRVGANHVSGRSAGLTGKHKWRRFADAYEYWRTPQGLPLDYRLVYWCMCK